jgi:hypothetical protein
VVCGTTVDGNLTVTGSRQGAPWNLGQCGGNTVKGSVTFHGNAASGNVLAGNTVGQDLTCTASGSVAASGNKVKGRAEGQCQQ